MQNANLILVALLSTVPLVASDKASLITLKIRTPVPAGHGMVSDIAFPIRVEPTSSIADVDKELSATMLRYACIEPTCASCAQCLYAQVARTLLANNKKFEFYRSTMRPLKNQVTLSQLRAAGWTDEESIGAIQPGS